MRRTHAFDARRGPGENAFVFALAHGRNVCVGWNVVFWSSLKFGAVWM